MFTKISTLKAHEQSFFALVIAIGVISVWRGIWHLSDVVLFPGEEFLASTDIHNYMMSALASLAIGLVVLGVTHYVVKELM